MNAEYYDMKPVRKPHTTETLGGRPAAEGESNVNGGMIGGMPITKNEERVVSVWRCDSWMWRLRFLLKGEVTLTVLGSRLPPVAVSVGDTLQRA